MTAPTTDHTTPERYVRIGDTDVFVNLDKLTLRGFIAIVLSTFTKGRIDIWGHHAAPALHIREASE